MADLNEKSCTNCAMIRKDNYHCKLCNRYWIYQDNWVRMEMKEIES